MSELAARPSEAAAALEGTSLLPRCGNPRCRTGWIQLWRNRRHPRLEGKWACSPECMEQLAALIVRREMAGVTDPEQAYVHRIPLGLMLLRQGSISREQIEEALRRQREQASPGGARMRIGQCLVSSGALSEPDLARAVAAQWSCPVFALKNGGEDIQAALPRLLSELTGALPVRMAAGKRLYLAFAGNVNRTLAYALERMTGLGVTVGVAQDSEFWPMHERYLTAQGPRTHVLEASGGAALARAVARLLERERPAEARLVRVHAWYWLRLWKRVPGTAGLPQLSDVDDYLCTLGNEIGGEA